MKKVLKVSTTIAIDLLVLVFVCIPLFVNSSYKKQVYASKNYSEESPIVVSNNTLNELSSSLMKLEEKIMEVSKTQVLGQSTTVSTPSSTVQTQQPIGTCSGTWFSVSAIGYPMNLNFTTLEQWNGASAPSVIEETKNNNNVVVIGHNPCRTGNCMGIHSEFAKIINTRIGDAGQLCLNGELYEGNIEFSQAVSEYDTHFRQLDEQRFCNNIYLLWKLSRSILWFNRPKMGHCV